MQQQRSHLRVMEAVEMCQRAVGLRDATRRGVESGSVGAGAAKFLGNGQRQQAARANVLALDGGGCQLAGEWVGGTESVVHGRQSRQRRQPRQRPRTGLHARSRHERQNAGSIDPANCSETKALTSGDWNAFTSRATRGLFCSPRVPRKDAAWHRTACGLAGHGPSDRKDGEVAPGGHAAMQP
jgi:hypothetical protein